MGNKQPYRDRIADGSLRTTNVAGYVSGGPAASPTNGWYDCNNLVNDSTNNTGLVTLPHSTGTGKDAGTAHSNNIWYSRGNPSNGNGCPEFTREQGANNAARLRRRRATQLCPYLTASGATVFTGPVYRYKSGADNSARWPKYWDGRWFLNDFGNASAKHALLLDRRPTRTAPSRSTRTASAAACRGARTTWTRSSVPTARSTSRSTRASSPPATTPACIASPTRAATTRPGPDPQWQSTTTARTVQFSIGASGGVSYEWDFGDGQTSAGTDPTHTYAASPAPTAPS